MKKIALFVSAVVWVSPSWTQPVVKSTETGFAQRSPLFESDTLGQITADTIPGFASSLDGTLHTVFRIRAAGAEAVRLRFEDVRLPSGGSLLVYGADALQPWIHRPGADAAPTVAGDTATVEIQCGVECPADLPFDIVEVERVTTAELEQAPGERGEVRAGNFHGIDLEYEVRNGLAVYEGDMILGDAHELEAMGGNGKAGSKEAVGITGSSYRWPGGVIPYVINSDIPSPSRITEAIAYWNSTMAGVIKLVPRTSQSLYVKFTRGSGCYSYIGMRTFSNGNPIVISDACSKGSVIHEIGHTVGLWHEQSRNDRDSYIKIRYENISPSNWFNFGRSGASGTHYGSYDYGSIMHYAAMLFSFNGKPAIETIPAGIPIGQRNNLSAGDIAAVRVMYGHSAAAPLPTMSTPPPVINPQPAPEPLPPVINPQPAPEPLPPTNSQPATVTVTVTANPLTESIVVDGVAYRGAARLTWVVGSSHTLSAVNRSLDSGASSSWHSWSDRGLQTHQVTASSTATAYTAVFRIHYSVVTTSNDTAAGAVTRSPLRDTYEANTSVSLSAEPAAGYCFAGWTGLIGGTPPTASVLVTKPYNVKANFQRGGLYVQTKAYVPKAGKVYGWSVLASSGCVWKPTTTASWITIENTATRTSSGVLDFTVAPNTSGVTRTGVIDLGERQVTVVQAGY